MHKITGKIKYYLIEDNLILKFNGFDLDLSNAICFALELNYTNNFHQYVRLTLYR